MGVIAWGFSRKRPATYKLYTNSSVWFGDAMSKAVNDQKDYDIAEYKALSDYYGKVITFRFTTASFFIAAVAVTLSAESPAAGHYVLLFLLSLGIWIVELRNRSIYDNLRKRGEEIETSWNKDKGRQRRFITNMSQDPKEIRTDRFCILIFRPVANRYVTHTLGFDIIYLSVMLYAGWQLYPIQMAASRGVTMDPVVAFFSFGVVLAGVLCAYRATSSDIKKDKAKFIGAVGVLLIAAAILLAGVKLFCK